VIAALDGAGTACILPGLLAKRTGLQDQVQSFIAATGLPFATMFGDKTVVDEQQPAYIGMYDGRLMDEDVRAFVESCDQVVTIGTLMTDFNTGAFTARIDSAKTIDIAHHHTRAGSHASPNVEMGDILTALAGCVTSRGGQTLTVQEISLLGGRGLTAVICVVNPSGYLLERLLCKDPAIEYNDVASWRYSAIPYALGCDGWFTARATSCGELDEALTQAGQ